MVLLQSGEAEIVRQGSWYEEVPDGAANGRSLGGTTRQSLRTAPRRHKLEDRAAAVWIKVGQDCEPALRPRSRRSGSASNLRQAPLKAG